MRDSPSSRPVCNGAYVAGCEVSDLGTCRALIWAAVAPEPGGGNEATGKSNGKSNYSEKRVGVPSAIRQHIRGFRLDLASRSSWITGS